MPTNIKLIRPSAIYRVMLSLMKQNNPCSCCSLLSMLEQGGNKLSNPLVKAVVDNDYHESCRLLELEILECEREEEMMMLRLINHREDLKTAISGV